MEIYGIAGRLQLDEVFDYLVACPGETETRWEPPGERRWEEREARCCDTLENGTILIGDDGSEFELPNFGCHGDQSRMCCNVVAKGQMVVATGLIELKDSGGPGKGWFFQGEVNLCTLPPK